MSDPDTQIFGTIAPQIVTTVPTVITRHSISDEELDTLCGENDAPRATILATAFGVGAGAFPGAVQAIVTWCNGASFTVVELTQVCMVVSAVTAAVITHLATRGAVHKSKALKSAIRSRGNANSGLIPGA